MKLKPSAIYCGALIISALLGDNTAMFVFSVMTLADHYRQRDEKQKGPNP